MAEVILGSVMESITGHLLSLVSKEIGLANGVTLELPKLQDTVSIVCGVLREAEKRQVDDESVKEWLKNLKDVAYDADDLLDDFSTQVLRRGQVMGRGKRITNEVRIFFSTSNQLTYACKMAHRVKDIRERLEAIHHDSEHFQLERISNFRSLVRVTPETYPFEPEPYVIGRDKDKKEVIDFLLDPDFEGNVSILPIVGLGGMGKTTLARSVFNDVSAREYFEVKLWICVSTNFNVEDILRKIIRECSSNKQFENVNVNELTGKDLRNLKKIKSANKDPGDLNEELAKLNMNELQKKLGAELDRKRFFIVLDDVWNENRSKWLKLQASLTKGAKGSKILVTTRTPHVAKTMAPKFHQLSGLPEKESLSLLMRMAMKEEDEWRGQNLEMIALEILKKCGGVPLAIMTIGRLLLFSRNTEEDWLSFKNNDLSRIKQEEGDIMPSLKLSYDFLPSHLKRCFAYCSLFPKDYELKPFQLIQLWMAQGFIKPSGNKKALEEVGHECFKELVSRSFFQDLEEDICGNVIGCKMHDLMHDLAMMVVGDDCITIDGPHGGKIPEESRHVSMVDIECHELKLGEQNQRMRSLLLINEKPSWIGTPYLDISCLRNLRALCLFNVQVDVSGLISKLKHLRSVDISRNRELKSLPNSISRLCNLETLILRGCQNLKRLPRGITKLVNLRQLDISGCHGLTHLPRGIGNLTNLEMLGAFVVGKKWNCNAARLNELSKLIRLRKELIILHLERLGSISSEVDASFSIENFGLQSLELCWEHVGKEYTANNEEALERLRPHPDLKKLRITGYDGANLSSWVIKLHKLVEIRIFNCKECKHLPSLHQLPFLKRISLSSMENLEWMELSEGETPQQSFFPSLEELNFRDLDRFKGWKWRRGDGNRIEEDIQEEDEEDSSSSSMLPSFFDKVKVRVAYCPRLSYMHQLELHLGVAGMKNLPQLRENVISDTPHSLTPTLPMAVPTPSMMTFISSSSISLSALTSLTIHELEDAEHFPVELFQSLRSLKSLVITYCPRLKSLPVRAILRYLNALETLEICRCKELNLSTEDNDGDDGGEGTYDHPKLRLLKIRGIEKMECLPRWIWHLSNLKDLQISECDGLKTLPGRLILLLLTTLESLKLMLCRELDLTGESEGQGDNPNLQFGGPTKLRELIILGIGRMKTLPWWIQHLTSLESLGLYDCPNLEALPDWFPRLTSLTSLTVCFCSELSKRCEKNKGKDWPKISHIQDVTVY